MHGGIGEDGTLQSLLETERVPYTGLYFFFNQPLLYTNSTGINFSFSFLFPFFFVLLKAPE